jgi:hypothetical protein
MLERYLKLQDAIFVFGAETRLFDNLDLKVLRNTVQLSREQLEMLYGVVEVLKVVRALYLASSNRIKRVAPLTSQLLPMSNIGTTPIFKPIFWRSICMCIDGAVGKDGAALPAVYA